jgi:hypothetical protein
MRMIAALVLALALTGCEQAPAPQPASDVGRYQMTIVPTGTLVPGMSYGIAPASLWVIDTKTGHVQFCQQKTEGTFCR